MMYRFQTVKNDFYWRRNTPYDRFVRLNMNLFVTKIAFAGDINEPGTDTTI